MAEINRVYGFAQYFLNESAKGAVWQREQLVSAQNCLFKDGTVTGNGDYTIGITDNGVIRRVIYLLDSNSGNGINSTQVNWMKAMEENIDHHYGAVPAFAFYNKKCVINYYINTVIRKQPF